MQLVDLPKLQEPSCAKAGMLNKSQMLSWIVQARIHYQCEMILVFHWQFNALMFLAFQHKLTTYAAIHDFHDLVCSSDVFGGCGFTIIYF